MERGLYPVGAVDWGRLRFSDPRGSRLSFTGPWELWGCCPLRENINMLIVRPSNRLLLRGLILCGWSGAWDHSLGSHRLLFSSSLRSKERGLSLLPYFDNTPLLLGANISGGNPRPLLILCRRTVARPVSLVFFRVSFQLLQGGLPCDQRARLSRGHKTGVPSNVEGLAST